MKTWEQRQFEGEVLEKGYPNKEGMFRTGDIMDAAAVSRDPRAFLRGYADYLNYFEPSYNQSSAYGVAQSNIRYAFISWHNNIPYRWDGLF